MNDALTETADRLRRAVARLQRRLRQSTSGSLTPGQVSVLASLDKHEALTLGELAALEGVRPPSLTPVVRALVHDGFVARSPDEADRRSARVRLTPLGRDELNLVRQRRNEFLERKLASLTTPDRERARELISFLESLLDES